MYVLITNGVVEKYPYSIGELRKDNPNTSFPKEPPESLLASYGVLPVIPTDRPQASHTKNVKEVTPVNLQGKWTQTWEVTNASAEEISARTEEKSSEVRGERDMLLASCDWTQGKDISEEVSAAWATYRQALRDIPQQGAFPWNVEWPVAPNSGE
jgi:hypothetical protein